MSFIEFIVGPYGQQYTTMILHSRTQLRAKLQGQRLSDFLLLTYIQLTTVASQVIELMCLHTRENQADV